MSENYFTTYHLKPSANFKDTFFVYILRCHDGSLFKGYTSNLHYTLSRHQDGFVLATAGKTPVELIFYCAFGDKYKALEFEKYLRSGSGRAFTNKHLI